MKIKFLDNPEEIIEVITAQQLTGTRVRLSSSDESYRVQQYLQELDILCGRDRERTLKHIGYTAITIYPNHYCFTWGDEYTNHSFREFILVSPETETDLTKQLETLQGPQAFIQTFDKVNPLEAGEAWWRELKKVDQLPQTQEALNDQLLKLRVIANKFGLYDAADYCKTSNF